MVNPALTTAYATGPASSPAGSNPAPMAVPSPTPITVFPPPSTPPASKSFGDYVVEVMGENPIGTALASGSMALCTYHGYKRNNSIGWAIGWGILGGMFPIITPVIAVAQGFAEPAHRAAALAALGTNKYTECLEPHVRALCFTGAMKGPLTSEEQMLLLDEERGDAHDLGKELRALLEKAGFDCKTVRREGDGFTEEVGECVRVTKR